MASEPRRDLPARPAPSGASGGRQAPLADALAALALAARVDALGAATTSFRSVVGERLVDLATEVARASDATGRRVADGQRAASSALVGIEAALRETEAGLAHLDAVAAALVTRVDDLAEELADVVVTSVRQGVEAAFDEVAGRVAGGTGPAVPPVAGGGGAAPAPVVDLTPVLDALDTLDAGLAEVVARPAVADLSPVADRLDALATGLAEVAALAGAAAHPSPPDLTPVTVRLDALAAGVAEVADRLPTVDLGSVADRLAAEIGGQGDRPEPALSSLAPLQGRLDELLELVADLAAATPDPGGPAILLGRLDELADMVAALLERPEPVAPDPVAPPAGPTPAPPEVLDALGRIEVALDGASTPAPPEVLDTLGRIETALAAAVPGAEVVAAIHTLEEVLGRLAAAQADDLERVLEAVEGGAVDGPASRALEAIGRVEAALDRPAAGTPAGIEAQLSTLTGEVAALRRRLAVRARTLGDEEVAALADAVAARLQGPGPAPRTAPVRRGKAASPTTQASPEQAGPAAQASPEQAGPPKVARRPRQPRPRRPADEG